MLEPYNNPLRPPDEGRREFAVRLSRKMKRLSIRIVNSE
jgi:hypothetical protein